MKCTKRIVGNQNRYSKRIIVLKFKRLSIIIIFGEQFIIPVWIIFNFHRNKLFYWKLKIKLLQIKRITQAWENEGQVSKRNNGQINWE